MYELFDAAEQGGQLFLIRIAQNRMTADIVVLVDNHNIN
jgi:hypothetical protein